MKEPLTLNDRIKLWPETILSLRLAAGWLEIVTTEGIALIEGQQLAHLLRLLLHDRIEHMKDKEAFCFGCRVDTVTLAARRPLPRHPLPFPDSCLMPAGWLCVEGKNWADYHPADSLQIIGAQGRRFLLGFAQTSYQMRPLDGEAEALRQGLLEDFSEGAKHITAWCPEAYLAWPASRRLHAETIEETPHRPDSWDTMDTLRDLRNGLEQRAFCKRLPESALPVIGIDR